MLKFIKFPISRSGDISSFSGEGGRGFQNFKVVKNGRVAHFFEFSKCLVFINVRFFQDMTIFDKVIP
jgi:hypothetical protein